MKGIIEFFKGLLGPKCPHGCPKGTCLLSDVVQEMAKMQKAEDEAARERAFLLKEMTALENEVARLTMAVAERDMEKSVLEKEMARVILHIAKEEAE